MQRRVAAKTRAAGERGCGSAVGVLTLDASFGSVHGFRSVSRLDLRTVMSSVVEVANRTNDVDGPSSVRSTLRPVLPSVVRAPRRLQIDTNIKLPAENPCAGTGTPNAGDRPDRMAAGFFW